MTFNQVGEEPSVNNEGQKGNVRMKGVVLAGGLGTRLDPLTRITNKHLLPVYNRPMIYYPIQTLVDAGIREILIVTGGNWAGDFLRLLGNGKDFGLKHLDYTYQEGEKGIAHALALAEHFADDGPITVILGDNIVDGDISSSLNAFSKQQEGARILLKTVDHPERFGVPEIRNGRIVSVEEKPEHPKSSFAVAGIYLYDSHIFEAVKAISPSARGELEISDAHQYLIDKGFTIGFTEITGWWKDTGKPTDLLEANRLVLDNITPDIQGSVDDRSTVAGKVVVQAGARIMNSVVRGPAIIGAGCLIEDSYVGPFSSVGNNSVVIRSEVEYSIILRECKILNVGIRLEGSILGNDVEIVEATGKPLVHRFMIGDQSRVEVV